MVGSVAVLENDEHNDELLLTVLPACPGIARYTEREVKRANMSRGGPETAVVYTPDL